MVFWVSVVWCLGFGLGFADWFISGVCDFRLWVVGFDGFAWEGLVLWCGVFYGFFWLFGILVCVAFRLRVS